MIRYYSPMEDDDIGIGKWVTLNAYDNSGMVHIDRIKLESEGIRVFIADENLVSLNWHYMGAIGGIKLQVREGDVAQAIEVLKLDIAPAQRVTPKEPCPDCQSLDTVYMHHHQFGRNPWTVLFVIVIYIFGLILPFLFPKRKMHCNACRHEWK